MLPNYLILIAYVISLFWGASKIITDPTGMRFSAIVTGIAVIILSLIGLFRTL